MLRASSSIRRAPRMFSTTSSAVVVPSAEEQKAKLNTKPMTLDFSQTERIFARKNTPLLARAYVVFTTCQIPFLVKNSMGLIDASYKVLGDKLTNYGLKQTFFGHFCAGEDAADIQPTLKQLDEAGIGAILDYAAEADVAAEKKSSLDGVDANELQARTYDYSDEEMCDANAKIVSQAIRDAPENGFAAVKCTALGKPELLQRMSSILVEAQVLFHSLDSKNLSQAKESHLKRLVDCPAFKEGIKRWGGKFSEEEVETLFRSLDKEQDGVIDYIDWVSLLNPMDLTMGPLTRFLKVDPLTPEEIKQVSQMMARLETLASEASVKKVKLMIDAEQTYMQPAIDHITLNLQRRYNTNGRDTIFNTFQCYLKDASDRVLIDLERADRESFKFACKLVRGAYMVQERKRAQDMGYEDPIQPTIEATHANYNALVELLLVHNHRTSFMVASHNEESVKKTVANMEALNIPRDNGGVYFGQLLGMCDHISYTLGAEKFQVFKYVPYGPVKEVLPYLIRRAQENSTMMKGGCAKELVLLNTELKRRVKSMLQ
ncbi:proline oxidase [Thraustotheca clavata]|uniref:Proline dehydrogenase n=1 Tax=Thraustotheca clavata TaxID=74557 RepID=A0A1V9Z4W4_9STRA|nr:proline oxidase [Thraustotheca clavata]